MTPLNSIPVKVAETTFCPFRVIAADMKEVQYGDVYCHNDLCMMWRWTDHDEAHGYCGLAGKP